MNAGHRFVIAGPLAHQRQHVVINPLHLGVDVRLAAKQGACQWLEIAKNRIGRDIAPTIGIAAGRCINKFEPAERQQADAPNSARPNGEARCQAGWPDCDAIGQSAERARAHRSFQIAANAKADIAPFRMQIINHRPASSGRDFHQIIGRNISGEFRRGQKEPQTDIWHIIASYLRAQIKCPRTSCFYKVTAMFLRMLRGIGKQKL